MGQIVFTPQSTQDMLAAVRIIKPKSSFWLDNFFQASYFSPNTYINFNLVYEQLRLANFVLPTVISKHGKRTGYDSKQFTPFYLKEKDSPDMEHNFIVGPDEPFGGNRTPKQRFDAARVEIALTHRDRIRATWNWLAAQAVIYGQVTVGGTEEYPTTTINFGRDGALTQTLTGSRMWDSSAATRLDDIEEMNQRSYDRCNVSPKSVIMGKTAWNWFKEGDDVQKILSTQIRNSNSSAEVGPGDSEPYQRMGTFGSVTVWKYNENYIDQNGVSQKFLDDRDVVACSASALRGVRAYGAIKDVASLKSEAIFVKEIITEEPSSLSILSQSAPLMMPMNPNASWRLRVGL